MNLILYTAPQSTANITEAVLLILAVPFERISLDIGHGDTQSSEFLRLNPNGRVPTLVHDGTPIWESAAITMYLGETFGVSRGLYPDLGPERGAAMKWIVWANVTLGEAGARWSAALPPGSEGAVERGSKDWVAPEERSVGAATRAEADISACIAVLNGALSDQQFLLRRYSLADTHLHVLVDLFVSMGLAMEPHPCVTAWLARCAKRVDPL